MIYCPSCGTPNADTASACGNCQAALPRPGQAPSPPEASVAFRQAPAAQINNYLVPAILVTLFCCLPAGIAAIVYAAQVNGKLQAGDIAGAQAAAGNAKMWTWISFGAGFCVIVVYVGLILVGAIANN
jgi:hypothetical protein